MYASTCMSVFMIYLPSLKNYLACICTIQNQPKNSEKKAKN